MTCKTNGRLVSVILLALELGLLTAQPLAAEVADKVPTEWALWRDGLALAAASVIAWRVRPWLGWAVLPVVLVFAIGSAGLVTDPNVGPAIRVELGLRYVLSAWFSAGLMAAGWAGGFWNYRRRAALSRSAA
jgi:hypothetical protein